MNSCVALLLVLVAVAYARPQFSQLQATHPVAQIVQRTHLQDDAGQFSYSVQGSDGQVRQEYGQLKPRADGKGHVLVYTGSYSYNDPDGKRVQVNYVADENGFQPTGNVIHPAPAPPPPAQTTF
ncbi:endocuticle structural glycoprotein ABD-5-like [Macrosteles quadrilineatus]|uniref:endocuticle structural glycoprotein ABD-5-like n=1 Tax=Macrosteles quadrilineatus TaxID=74068 RepID=UPI0023E2EEE5|nr:endocuticle structural glycoprotein ABD-5-like [Macrosteles quadrilineatus]XP_054287914.1 endocuticle structural glycoprotein ABD-5-like [Macrosteles quadrilineatus]